MDRTLHRYQSSFGDMTVSPTAAKSGGSIRAVGSARRNGWSRNASRKSDDGVFVVIIFVLTKMAVVRSNESEEVTLHLRTDSID